MRKGQDISTQALSSSTTPTGAGAAIDVTDFRTLALLTMARAAGPNRIRHVLERHPEWPSLSRRLAAHDGSTSSPQTPDAAPDCGAQADHGAFAGPQDKNPRPGTSDVRHWVTSAEQTRSLEALLWQELHSLEENLPEHFRVFQDAPQTACCYALRRRVLADWRALDRLEAAHGVWRHLAAMDADRMAAALEALGTAMISAAMILEPAERVALWLKPLGTALARQVVDRVRLVGPVMVSKPLTRCWHRAYGNLQGECGPAITARLGESLLAALFWQLPDEARQVLLPFLGARLTRPAQIGICPATNLREVHSLLRGVLELDLE